MPPNRRLPVLQESAAPDDGRPAWHWTLIGALFAVSIWLPLAMLAVWLTNSLFSLGTKGASPADEQRYLRQSEFDVLFLIAAVLVVPFVLACLASGALVGRFGNRAGVKEAAQGCVLAATVGVMGSSLQLGWAAWVSLPVLVLVGGAAGWLGGRLGWARRPLAERRPRA